MSHDRNIFRPYTSLAHPARDTHLNIIYVFKWISDFNKKWNVSSDVSADFPASNFTEHLFRCIRVAIDGQEDAAQLLDAFHQFFVSYAPGVFFDTHISLEIVFRPRHCHKQALNNSRRKRLSPLLLISSTFLHILLPLSLSLPTHLSRVQVHAA